jgi:hypothetical protein
MPGQAFEAITLKRVTARRHGQDSAGRGREFLYVIRHSRVRRESGLMATNAKEPKPVSELTVEGRVSQDSMGYGRTSGADEQFLAALRLFETGRVTTSQAAAMCGMPSVDFLLAAERSNQPRSAARV